jgi:hypothetical protein
MTKRGAWIRRSDIAAFPAAIRAQLRTHFAAGDLCVDPIEPQGPAAFRADAVYDAELRERFGSKTEHARARELMLLQKAGEISGLRFHPLVIMLDAPKRRERVAIELDSAYVENGREIFEDVKGFKLTGRFRLFCQLWRFFGPGRLRITKREGRGFVIVREIDPVYRAE